METLTISDEDFRQLVGERARTMLSLVSYLSRRESSDKPLTRPLLGQLLSQSIQLEELLDAYDAGNNCRWCLFRSLAAAIKIFTNLSYELLHIQHALPAYRLLAIEADFVKATSGALGFTNDVILRAAEDILKEAGRLQLPIPATTPHGQDYDERLPAGRLPHNCQALRKGTASETVTLLATAFLNLAAESQQVCAASGAQPEEYAAYVAESASEESLRGLELRFHNLQSLYDTHVSGTELEKADTKLPVLRGHISVVLHLLRTATALAHYYERHVNKPVCELQANRVPLVNAELLLAMLVNYSVGFSGRYIVCAQRLCQERLKRYAEVGRIEVPVPPYRGFHVRPSTLIAKLVLHYGSEVKMELEGEQYDASLPLELFRANEKINAEKRRWLTAEIVRLGLVAEQERDTDVGGVVRELLLALAESGKLVVYVQPLRLPVGLGRTEGTLLEQVTGQMAQFLATGKIDISTDLKVAFIGDKRVLADIKLLAESGYGEDSFGNNTTLPKELTYLRR